jgi:predicted nucleic acid-binding protein
MPNIFSALDECCFEKHLILFDTNVWIAIYGNDPRHDRATYSDYYASALRKNNTVCVNDQILGEYFNRVCKVEYEELFGKNQWDQYKSRRKEHEEYIERVESVRDTCLNILDDCKYVESLNDKGAMADCIEHAAKGGLDLTDTSIAHCCTKHEMILVSHDSDFAESELNLVTANWRTLRKLK